VVRKEPTVYRRTLARAIEIAGGVEPLARFLACTPSEIARWTSGEFNPPMPFFLAMVDIAAAKRADGDGARESSRRARPQEHLDSPLRIRADPVETSCDASSR
jgi:hypothetical protein